MTETLLLGSYTEELPHVHGRAQGLMVAEYGDPIGPLRTVRVRNPSWLAASADGSHVYAVIEAGGGDAGEVAVFSSRDGSLALKQRASSGGHEPAHLAVDPSGRFLIVSNYADGRVAVLALRSDGFVDGLTHVVQHQGASVHPRRQRSAHPHQVVPDGRTGTLLVTDLGLDAVISYALDDSGRLSELGRVALPAGSGPRHLALHPDGQHVLVVNELTSTVAVLARSGSTFVVRSVISTLPAGHSAPNQASAVAVTSVGDAVYVSNRGHDSIAVFAWNAGALKPLQFEPTRGRTPRDVALSPDGALLHVGNQDSDSVVTFERTSTGLLEFRDQFFAPTPVCLVIASLS
ncbi:lactonase family protein [Yonghaparkia sp. Soil809]|uniref:lactonase family protein n=1 Tax=Yonghaparkia sp. Soil809 TaxID=1736417 RepID=UPI0006F40A83|nr:lactonase family protein [Yonghaparkia sp. Soil809]KRF32850.1 hypothetical protein ASG83_02145 [Yonghaparkia sp. Soil809]